MVSITITIDENLKGKIEKFPWVNWSEVAREEILKKEIFETYIKTGKISKEDLEFCNKMDWHPVDELALKEEFVKELKKIRKTKHQKMTLKELDDLLGIK